MDMRSEVCTVQEAATRLRVSTATIRRLISASQLPAARVGRSVRVLCAGINRLLVNGGAPKGNDRCRARVAQSIHKAGSRHREIPAKGAAR